MLHLACCILFAASPSTASVGRIIDDHPSADDVVAVRLELATMIAVDQSVRRVFMLRPWPAEREKSILDAYRKKLGDMDGNHTKRLKELVERWGWIRSSVFGADAATHAWLLVQHADRDPAWQQHVLTLMEKALATGDAAPNDFAYLTDRVLVAMKKPQRYGTQGDCAGRIWRPDAMEIPEHVDERRARIGLPPLAEYIASNTQDVCRAPPGGK